MITLVASNTIYVCTTQNEPRHHLCVSLPLNLLRFHAMVVDKNLPLQSSNANMPAKPVMKTIKETYQEKIQLEHILLQPNTYISSIEKHTQALWVFENNKMVH